MVTSFCPPWVAFGTMACVAVLLTIASIVSGQVPETDFRLPMNQQADQRAKELKGSAAIAYGYDSKGTLVNFPIKIVEKLIDENYPDDLISATLGDESNRGIFNEASPLSLALVKADKSEMIGLYLFEQEELLYFMDLWEYKDVFCTYLNLGCNATSSGINYLDNRIPWFDRFIFFNGTN